MREKARSLYWEHEKKKQKVKVWVYPESNLSNWGS